MQRIIRTTDGKYIGITFSKIEDLELPDGFLFEAYQVQQLTDGLARYSNTNYVILTEEI